MSDDQIVPELETILHRGVKSDSSLELSRQKRQDNSCRSRSCGDDFQFHADTNGRKRTANRRLQKQDTLEDEVFPADVEYRQRSQSKSKAHDRRDTYRKSSGYCTQGSKETPQTSFETIQVTTMHPHVRQDSAISLGQTAFDMMRSDQDNLPNLSILLLSGERPFSVTFTNTVVPDQGIADNLPFLSILQGTNLLSNDDSIELPQDISIFSDDSDQEFTPNTDDIVGKLAARALGNESLPTHEISGAQAQLVPSNSELKKMLIENYLISKNLTMDPSALQILMRELPSDTSTPNQSPLDALVSRAPSGQLRAQKSPSKSPESPLVSFGFDCDEATAKKIKLSEPESRQSVIISQILRASRCNQKACLDDECKKGRDYLKCVENSLKKGTDAVNSKCQEIIICLIEHRKQCEEFCCTSIWCHRLQGLQYLRCEDDRSAILGFMCSVVQSPLLKFSEIDYRKSLFTKLSPKCQYDTTVTEGMDWIPMSTLGAYGDVVIAADIHDESYSIVKKMEALDYQQHVNIYKRLKLVCHTNIVDHLWLIEYGTTNYICTEFESGGSLYHVLQDQGKLPMAKSLKYVKPLLHAAMFLHKMGILYMAWSSDNVVFNVSMQIVKLSNFSMAIPLGIDFDEDGTKRSLPPHLLPPEFLLGQELTALTDTWGVGCLCAELANGLPVHSDWIHDSKETIWEKLKVNPIPSIPKHVDGIIQDLCAACWKKNPADRPSMKTLLANLS